MHGLNTISLNIGQKIILGFVVLFIVFLFAVTVTLSTVIDSKTGINRLNNQRVPTASASGAMVNNVNASLAALRGWMLTGNANFKSQRATIWRDIDATQKNMDRLAPSWTNPANIEKWNDFKVILEEFRAAQEKVENIAHSVDEQPAVRILVEEAAPRAAQITAQITTMINEERTQQVTAERKRLLISMADFRGSMGMVLANIRALLLTGNPDFRAEFDKFWTLNQRSFDELVANQKLMSASQQAAFDILSENRSVFMSLPNTMFDIRQSDQWNMAGYLLLAEAAPRAAKLLDILSGEPNANGERNGGMVANQRLLLSQDADSLLASIEDLILLEWILLISGALIAMAAIFLTRRSIVPPLIHIIEIIKDLTNGNYKMDVPFTDRKDEIGTIAQAVLVFRDNAREQVDLNARVKKSLDDQRAQEQQIEEDEKKRREADREAERQLSEEREAKAQKLSEMIRTFDKSITDILALVSSSATELESTANSLSAIAEETGVQSSSVSSAAEQASVNVQTVASATEELGASIAEIGTQMERSSSSTQEVVERAQSTTEVMSGLADTSSAISNIVNLINDIAEQTNLLALNATIEAARAGEAGRGFAVVASEVKSLASQTADATNQISQQIEDVQAKIREATQAVEGISSSIETTASLATAVAAAVQEQEATALDISRNIAEAAKGTGEVSSNINGVASGNTETISAATQVLSTSQQLAQHSAQLKGTIDTFLEDVRMVG